MARLRKTALPLPSPLTDPQPREEDVALKYVFHLRINPSTTAKCGAHFAESVIRGAEIIAPHDHPAMCPDCLARLMASPPHDRSMIGAVKIPRRPA